MSGSMLVFPVYPGKWKPFRWGITLSILATGFGWLYCISPGPDNHCALSGFLEYFITWFFLFIIITSLLYFVTIFGKWLSPKDDDDKDWWKP